MPKVIAARQARFGHGTQSGYVSKFYKLISVGALILPLFAVPTLANEPFVGSLAGQDSTGGQHIDTGVESQNAQGDRMEGAFRSWASRWGVPNAALVVMKGDKRLIGHVNDIGSYRIRQAVPVASLSKAITGACIAKLVDDGTISYTSRLKNLMGGLLNQNPPGDNRARNITVRQLLTHTSGITYDPSQGSPFMLTLNFRRVHDKEFFNEALSVPLGHAPGTAYSYNNINYSALALIINRFSGGMGYQAYCKSRLFAPLGITSARFNPNWRIMSAFGGWRISAFDFAVFLKHYRPSLRPRLIELHPRYWPKWSLGGGASYSIGTLMRPSGTNTFNFWHAGSWQWNGSPYSASFGAYFVSARNQLRYVATYSPTISSSALSDLDSVLWAAAFP